MRTNLHVPHSLRRALPWCGLLLIVLGSAPRLGAEEPSDGLFITVQNPITSEVTHRVSETTSRAVQRWRDSNPEPNSRFKLVYDFNPDGKPSGSPDFGPCHDLAKFLLAQQDVSTIAFVHNETTRHTVMPVLACKEIVMSAEASLGDVLRGAAGPLTPGERQAYLDVAAGRSRIPAVVLKLLDPDVVLLEGRTRTGEVWYLDARHRAEEEARGVVVGRAEPILPAGRESSLLRASQAQKLGLCTLIKESRREVANAYRLPASSLNEDPLVGRNPVAWHMEVTGPVNGALQETMERRIRRAIGQRANLLIFELRCGGGDTQVARDLAEFLRNLRDDAGDQPVMTVAYIPEKAPDTAVYLALACSEIVMHKDATLGDFTRVVTERRGGRDVDLPTDSFRLKMEGLMGLAEARGYDPLLARGMMDRKLSLYQCVKLKGQREWRILTGEELQADSAAGKDRLWGQERLVKEGGDNGRLLVLTADEARQLGVARHVVEGLPEMYATYGLTPSKVREARGDWLDRIADFLRHPAVATLLVMIGITCLILELKLPGFGIPGVSAAVCFVLFFWAHSQFAGQMTILAVALFILSLLLIALEVFVLPGFGVAGISGLLLMLGSLALVAYGHWPQSTGEWAGYSRVVGQIFLAMVAAVIAALVIARYLPNIPLANRLLLPPQPEGAESFGEAVALPPGQDPAALLGAIGAAATPLRPAGKMQFGEEFIDVVTEGGYVEAGARVQVIEIEGNRIIVKELA